MRVEVNGERREFPAAGTLADVLAERGTPEKGIAVALDGEVVPRAAWADTPVADGARVEIMTAVQGG